MPTPASTQSSQTQSSQALFECSICNEDALSSLHKICTCGHDICFDCAVKITEPKDARCPYCSTKISLANISTEVKSQSKPLTGISRAKAQAEALGLNHGWGGLSATYLSRMPMR